ncbi:hypothetical protein HG536_0F01320 [Torulaspora globosa]|uniref:ATP-dependent RNA helicase n=1 Tax=Torulaspora globosa TaxID=48254 RepID=A0A7G3ZJX1_9SACH|nr:uncharacterized protein HG536_0F01320 [Torulaspora globosa]QLL33807.1 hypothetical protein HG536_0F01320 [Torulaspora globosa]
MSDDDGMLLNFDTNADFGEKTVAKVTGGRWKDRRRLKMMVTGQQPNKKRKIEKARENDRERQEIVPREASVGKNVEVEAKNARTAPLVAGPQVVSSLFTSNREISTSSNDNARDESAVHKPSNAPLFKDTFESVGVQELLVNHLKEKMRIQKPTSIQKLVFSYLLLADEGRDKDLFINAQTGSGKTLAYFLPILSRILQMNVRVDRKSGCFALIVAPTRELASQIYSVISMLTNCCHYLVPCLLIGGERKKSEKARLRKGCNFIIGTPGRILDHLQNTQVIREQLSHTLRYIVLDEGDKLMELGFEETIRDILNILHQVPVSTERYPQLPSRIVHVLCSATMQNGAAKLGDVALNDYKLLSTRKKKHDDAINEAPDQLLQRVVVVPPKLRLVTLAGGLDEIHRKHKQTKSSQTSRTMVFLSCSDSVEFHYETFSSNDAYHRNLVGESVRLMDKGNSILPSFLSDTDPDVVFYKLHGSLSQPIRTSTLESFSKDSASTKGKHLIMFCTDVASRGLDLPHVGTVLEVDPPFSTEDHLHRIGRTARAGQSGEALLFLLPGEEEGYLGKIKPYHPKGWKLLKYDEDLLKPAFQETSVRRSDRNDKPDGTIHDWDTNATTWHLNVERRVLEDSTFKSLAIKAFTSHVRAYATHISDEKAFFNIKLLHLGHLAKSFGLRERPKGIGAQNSSEKDSSKKTPKENTKNKMFRLARMAVKESASEFNY